MNDEKDQIVHREVGATADHAITYHFQYEFEKSLALIRSESDARTTRNGLFALITDLAGNIIQNVDDEEVATMVQNELALLDSDDLSPKTTMDYLAYDKNYHLTYDSYNVKCQPEELPVAMEQLNREREEVTIRKLWAMLGRLKAIAYKYKVFRSSFVVDRSDIYD